MLTKVLTPIENIPKFRSLVFWIPLSKFIPVAKKTFLGSRFFFISTAPAQTGVELILFNGSKKGRRLKFITTCVDTFFFLHDSLINAFLHATDNQFSSYFFYKPVSIGHGLREIMSRVYM